MSHLLEGALFEYAEFCLLVVEAGEDFGCILLGGFDFVLEEFSIVAGGSYGYTEDA